MDRSRAFREFREGVISALIQTGAASRGKNRNEISVIVAGVSFYQQTLRLWHDATDQETWLVRDPCNRASRNAITVMAPGGKLGHIPEPVAEILAPHLDGGRIQLGVVWHSSYEFDRQGETFIGLRLEVSVDEWTDDLLEEWRRDR